VLSVECGPARWATHSEPTPPLDLKDEPVFEEPPLHAVLSVVPTHEGSDEMRVHLNFHKPYALPGPFVPPAPPQKPPGAEAIGQEKEEPPFDPGFLPYLDDILVPPMPEVVIPPPPQFVAAELLPLPGYHEPTPPAPVGYLPGLRPAILLDMSGTMHGCHIPLKRVVRHPSASPPPAFPLPTQPSSILCYDASSLSKSNCTVAFSNSCHGVIRQQTRWGEWRAGAQVHDLLNPEGELTCSAQFFDVVAFARGARCFGAEQRALDERRREVEAGVVAHGRPMGGRHRLRPQSAVKVRRRVSIPMGFLRLG